MVRITAPRVTRTHVTAGTAVSVNLLHLASRVQCVGLLWKHNGPIC